MLRREGREEGGMGGMGGMGCTGEGMTGDGTRQADLIVFA